MVGVQPGELVVDLCAGPGGKATAMAADHPGLVIASDAQEMRAGLVAANVARLGSTHVAVLTADGRRPPLRPGMADRVLVDAPCSGLGVLRRRPDARWRITEQDVVELAALQGALLDAAVPLLRPGGTLVYSACTLTIAETVAIDARLEAAHPELDALPPPAAPWEPIGRGARLLPQAAGTDGMYVLRLQRT
jgi:16S rRNA (cytosine967-C5)-methyltransferase